MRPLEYIGPNTYTYKYKNLNGPLKYLLGVRNGAHLMVPGQWAAVMTA